ncbi:MAG: LysR family transcriptional regulator [Clostridia bacterium]
MTIQQCRYVLEVVKRGSFCEAAHALFVAQTSISSGVKALENELKIKIFERSNKGVFLTREGTEFVQQASRIVEQADFMLRHYSAEERPEKLTVSTQHYDFIAEVFSDFLNRAGKESFNFSLRETRTYDVIGDVEKSVSDIGIIAISSRNDQLMERFLNQKHLTFYPLVQTSPHVFIRNTHPLADRQCLTEGDLFRYPYIFYEQGEHNSPFFTEELSAVSHNRKNVEITDRATLMNLLLQTDCYTIGTGIMTSKLNNGSIIAIRLQSDEMYMIGYLLKNDKTVSGHLQTFIRMLTDFFQQT